MQTLIGIDVTKILAASAVPEFRLGVVAHVINPDTGDSREYVYGRANGAITAAGYVCVEQTGYDFTMASVTSTTPGQSGPGSRVGVAQAALADNQYGWFQVYGRGPVRTAASAARGTKLNTTAVNGVVDDDATVGSETIDGLVLLTATGGAEATNQDAMLAYPSVGRTL